MRSFWNNLGDPGLHLLAIAMLLAYLAFGGGWPGETSAEAPLPYCKACHAHFMPGKPCECETPGPVARAFR